ncbi:hypothetical protein WAF17_10755 [Bernardetia sp. ABR2-2B]|uniref:hypothetical protein n=1 Tax=Bernardetia sp. ABR2-2B TaxID=3127472 RepID=UPI0030D43FBC
MKRLLNEEDIKEYATKRMTKEEVSKDESVELFNYLQPLEKNELEIGKVRHFDFEDLKD